MKFKTSIRTFGPSTVDLFQPKSGSCVFEQHGAACDNEGHWLAIKYGKTEYGYLVGIRAKQYAVVLATIRAACFVTQPLRSRTRQRIHGNEKSNKRLRTSSVLGSDSRAMRSCVSATIGARACFASTAGTLSARRSIGSAA
jgi:hypothetical protein